MTPRRRFRVAFSASPAAAVGVAVALRAGQRSAFARAGAGAVIIGAVNAAWDSLKAGRGLGAMIRHVLSPARMPSETEGLAPMVLGTLIRALGDQIGTLIRQTAARPAIVVGQFGLMP